ncbi:hypothetical protein [Oligoflexus tunisiensis]|uniref:hypothetical protein n=1 Tax=Oligoflexus tunisiensis TaxID=708132 RepID=UPI00114D3953|nr:hypothetical protein [Oligoflexus tunisiensis]
MLESNDANLESELIRVVQEQAGPLNLEEIFSCLYDRRDRLSELMATHKETALAKRRVKRSLDRSAHRGLLETSWENGQVYYRASQHLAFASEPQRFDSRPSVHDRLLFIFCIVAFLVLASVILFFFPDAESSGVLFSM